MCQQAGAQEDTKRKPPRERDVDDLIFRDEQEWQKSDR